MLKITEKLDNTIPKKIYRGVTNNDINNNNNNIEDSNNNNNNDIEGRS